jgi:hypothetical protein
MTLTEDQIQLLVDQADPLAIWHLFTDQGLREEANFVESKYFEL